jgi:hypothetical protein
VHETSAVGSETACREPGSFFFDHDDFGLIQSKIVVIDSNKLERDAQISLRNLRQLDCAGKPVPTFLHPALEIPARACSRGGGQSHQ